MIDVGGDNRPPSGNLITHELRRDRLWDRGAEVLALTTRVNEIGAGLALLVFADGDKLHLRRDDAFASVVHLRDIGARLGPAPFAYQVWKRDSVVV